MRVHKVLGILILFSLGVYGETEWWKSMSLYQIYPRSFKDSDGDGIGDLKGVQSKLQYLVDSGFNAFWLSPVYSSPMVDAGYDITDFTNIDPTFGTMQDFDDLLEQAHNLSIKVIMDLVPNHSSDQHEWFKKSIKKIEPYTDYYIWNEGKIVDGVRQPPNNWISVFHGSSWTWNDERQAYYFHKFAAVQPDFNFRNEHMAEEFKKVLRFWLDKGVDGFRMDAIHHLFEDKDLRDEPLTGRTNDPLSFDYTDQIYTKDLDENYGMVRQWRDVLDKYSGPRVMLIEAYANISSTMNYYEQGAHFPFNFGLIGYNQNSSNAEEYKEVVDTWMKNMPEGAVANWVTGNHDQKRLVARVGPNLALAVTTMVQLLPGIVITYNGEEIGMENTWLSFEETVDPQGYNMGPDRYEERTRDPCRTPFQWDATVSAGFSTNPKPWLRVNDNYKTLNLAAEKAADRSYYKTYLKMTELRKLPSVKEGSLQTRLLNNDVFAFSRALEGEKTVFVFINFAHQPQVVDLESFENAPSKVQFYHSTQDIGVEDGSCVEANQLHIPPRGASVFISTN